jgi:hypothetical protein
MNVRKFLVKDGESLQQVDICDVGSGVYEAVVRSVDGRVALVVRDTGNGYTVFTDPPLVVDAKRAELDYAFEGDLRLAVDMLRHCDHRFEPKRRQWEIKT